MRLAIAMANGIYWQLYRLGHASQARPQGRLLQPCLGLPLPQCLSTSHNGRAVAVARLWRLLPFLLLLPYCAVRECYRLVNSMRMAISQRVPVL